MLKGNLGYKLKDQISAISKVVWTLNNIRIEKTILAPICTTKIFLEILALLDVRHCPKLQSCSISRKTNDATLRKWQKS